MVPCRGDRDPFITVPCRGDRDPLSVDYLSKYVLNKRLVLQMIATGSRKYLTAHFVIRYVVSNEVRCVFCRGYGGRRFA
jgi:hypothetical protein